MFDKRFGFLDFEASSLSKNSFPVEVAWCSSDLTRGGSWLIRPEPHWTEWSPASQAIHGLSIEDLAAGGLPADEVMGVLNEDLADPGVVVSDNPEFDACWLRVLEDGAGVPAAFGVAEASLDAVLVAAHRKTGVAVNEVHPLAVQLMAREAGLVAHRALDDCLRHALALSTVALSQLAKTDAQAAKVLRSELIRRASSLLSTHGRRLGGAAPRVGV